MSERNWEELRRIGRSSTSLELRDQIARATCRVSERDWPTVKHEGRFAMADLVIGMMIDAGYRLAANARPEQVTLAMVQQNVMDTMVRVHGHIQDETYRNLLDAMYEHVPKALAQLPWPQGSGALHPLPKEGWREVDDALAASTQDAPTEVKDGD